MNRVRRIKIERNDIFLDTKSRRFRSMLSFQQGKGKSIPVYEVAGTRKNLPQEENKSLEKLISLSGNG